MKTSKKVIVAILGLAIAIAPTAQAISLKATGALGLFASACLLQFRRSVKDFEPRYSVEKIKDIKNSTNSAEEFKDYLRNLWYFFYDGFVGQKGKLKIKLKAENGEKIEFSGTEEIPPHGVLGNVDFAVKPIEDAAKTAIAVFVGYKFAKNINDDNGWLSGFSSKADEKLKTQSCCGTTPTKAETKAKEDAAAAKAKAKEVAMKKTVSEAIAEKNAEKANIKNLVKNLVKKTMNPKAACCSAASAEAKKDSEE